MNSFLHKLDRRLNRRLNHSLGRPGTRWLNSGPRPAPADYLGQALIACRRAIRARRRLMKLAPEHFDAAVVDRLARETAEADAMESEFRSVAARIYGVEESALPPRSVRSPARRHVRAEAAIEQELAASECSLALGRESLQHFRERRPHAVPSLRRIAALIDVASRLGRLSTGLETTQRKTAELLDPNVSFREALQRIYGSESSSSPQTDAEVTGS